MVNKRLLLLTCFDEIECNLYMRHALGIMIIFWVFGELLREEEMLFGFSYERIFEFDKVIVDLVESVVKLSIVIFD